LYKYADYNRDRSRYLRENGICLCCAVNPVSFGRGNVLIRYCAECRYRILEDTNTRRAEMKLEVLSHYGKDGHLLCSWPDCTVIDPDMLTIDHIDNTGAKERYKDRTMVGLTLYAKLKRLDYPEGFQTLCHNHQWKKELMRRRCK
jgi:hypothetical protein